ncbi:DNA fragmentation factor subunit alpha isoform X6 [Gopherus flavomarginatus]|uniref:DNA fragmentation factor subunit alpha isoform X6 n=1 Tax=Gopherus flavomarginatus TaxID=286002 RepID=UPI0021CBBDBF|nr:DNA fragmentation factor subunit alpha isoform X6 [Gopherus flavomarginatus]
MAGEGPGSGEGVSPLKQCLIRRKSQQEHHGVAASCLRELRSKACDILAIDKAWEPITLVLAEDGTIVDDEDYFLCLPPNTKFVALARNEKWTSSYTDGGTAWLSRESIDEVDCGEEKWKHLARQLKDDLSSIILMSEEDLQLVFKEDTEALALALSWDKEKTEALQQACDQELSRRLQQVQALHSLRSISKGKKKLPWGDWLSSKRKNSPHHPGDRSQQEKKTGGVVDTCGTLPDTALQQATSLPCKLSFFLWAGAKLPAQLFLYFSSPTFSHEKTKSN